MFINALAKSLISPIGAMIILLIAAISLSKRSSNYLRYSLVGCLAILLLASNPRATLWLGGMIDDVKPLDHSQIAEAQAIVVLGSGRARNAPSFGGDALNAVGLQRVRYGAKLQRETGLPLYTSGGKLPQEQLSEAELMGNAITDEFGAKVAGLEKHSKTTRENALFTACLLRKSGASLPKILLVTTADHMTRSVYAFEQAGFEVIAAPTAFYVPQREAGKKQWLPTVEALYANSRLVQELVGRVVYRRASWQQQCGK